MLKAAEAYDRFGDEVVRAMSRATTITSASVERFNGKVDENEQLLHAIRAKRAHLQDMLRERKASTVAASVALTNLDHELECFRAKIEDAGVDNGDPASEEEHKRIMSALKTAISKGLDVVS